MRFGTSAVVRVGRTNVAARGPMTGYRAAPQNQVPNHVRVGQPLGGANTPTSGAPVVNFVPGSGYAGGCATAYDWSLACKRVIGTGRKKVLAGETVEFNVTPCGPFRIDCVIIPESFALNFELTSIKVCRDDFITAGNPLPAEAFSDQSNYACNLACGAVFFPSLPLIIGVHNITMADKDFSALVIGAEMSFCG